MPTTIDKKRLYQLLNSEKNPSYRKAVELFRRKKAEAEELKNRIWSAEEEELRSIFGKVSRNEVPLMEGLGEASGERVAAWKETDFLIKTRLRSERDSIRAELLLNPGFICATSRDTEDHLSILRGNLMETLKDFDVNAIPELMLVKKEMLLQLLRADVEIVKLSVEANTIINHVQICALALGISPPRKFRGWFVAEFGDEEASKFEADVRFPEYAERLKNAGEARIAEELLRMLYPKKWERLLGDCTEKKIVAAAPGPVTRLPAPSRSRGGDFLLGHGKMESGGPDPWGLEGAQPETGGRGASDFREIFLVSNAVEKILSFGKGGKEDIDNNHSAWKRLMPGGFAARDGAILSAVLAISAPAPEERGGMLEVLEEHCGDIVETIVEGPPEAGEAASAYDELLEYAERFAKRREFPEPAEPEPAEAGEARKGKVELKRPHESLEFPAQVSHEIGEAGLSEENLKRVLVYGLRLSSRKAAIGGKYFMVPAFRRNAERVVESDIAHPREAVEGIEGFLYKHGVISYYKNDRVIMLNLKGEIGRHNKPDGAGQAILDAVVGWKNEFDRGNSHGSGNGNGNGNE